ncbi:MAG: 50S ribosomal protein L32e [Candidatus Altiarchaeota archaeon]|nr:50S ribosomal protein L32e [Candidatus Altiarchaeota archaeon]
MSKDFKRQEHWKYKSLGTKWRKARGAKNPYKEGRGAGKPATPSAGYRSPRATRGKHPSGLIEVRVFRPKDLEGLSKETNIVRIAGTVGAKKRIDIFKKARETGIRVIQNEPKSSEKNSG